MERIHLTNRQIEVLRHVAAGMTNHEIARKMQLSPNTIKGYIYEMMIKTNTGNRVELCGYGLSVGLVSLSDFWKPTN